MSETIAHKQSNAIPKEHKPKAPDAEELASPVLTRLIEEVRNEGAKDSRAYDRVHNRHNR